MSEQLSVGVIGAGNMGQHHVRNYYQMPEVDLVAIADSDLGEQGHELADRYGAQYFTDYEEMLDVARPNAVSVAVPTYLHHEVATKTLKRGIHTLIEKPITRNIEQANELIDLAQQQDVVLTVGHIERYNPIISELKRIIDSGELGTVTSIISQRLGGFPRTEPESDVIVDLAIHDIDVMSYLTGCEPEVVGAHGTNTFHSSETDSAEILLRYGNASGFVQANWISPVKVRKLLVAGSKGYMEANYITQEITAFQHMAIRTQDNFDQFVRRLGEPVKKMIKFEQDERSEPLRRELGAFAMAAAGEQPELLVNPADAVIALRTALMVTERIKSS